MTIRQPQFEGILAQLNSAITLLEAEDLDDSAKHTEKLINRIKEAGSIIPSHKNRIYSVLRMMLESNTYYGSKAGDQLERAFLLIKEELGENV